jgi:2-polyprenyl-6-methoxyphenol hydroxylase-like FAD-dependent oxidoreductase
VLETLYAQIEDKTKILINKRIDHVDHEDDGVVVYCTDGSVFKGDIIAGADGVNSQTRHQMWAAADEEEPGAIPKEDKECMTAEYKCLFGIASPVKNFPPGYVDITYGKDKSSLCVSGKEGRYYFFIFEKMDKVYRYPNIPKYTAADAEDFAKRNCDFNIQSKDGPTGAIKFSDVWENRLSFSLVALEEAEYQRWTWGRFVCLGDGIHKMTPNAGAGGNSAIESAAALANTLYDLKEATMDKPLNRQDIEKALTGYQRNRQNRAHAVLRLANRVTRMHAMKTMADQIMSFYVGPLLGDYTADLSVDFVIGATRINYLPIPARSLKGNMPFNPAQGIGNKESYAKRLFIALPFVALSWMAVRNLLPVSDSVAPWYLPSFLADNGVVYSILLIESTRRTNALNLVTFL